MIEKVLFWANKENQPSLTNGMLNFELIPGISLDFEEMKDEEEVMAQDYENVESGNVVYEANLNELNRSGPSVISSDEESTSLSKDNVKSGAEDFFQDENNSSVYDAVSIDSNQESTADVESIASEMSVVIEERKVPM